MSSKALLRRIERILQSNSRSAARRPFAPIVCAREASWRRPRVASAMLSGESSVVHNPRLQTLYQCLSLEARVATTGLPAANASNSFTGSTASMYSFRGWGMTTSWAAFRKAPTCR